MWFVFIFGFLLATVASYWATKARMRGDWMFERIHRLANPTATVLFACAVLACIGASMLFSGPDNRGFKARRHNDRAQLERLMASRLGEVLAAKVKEGPVEAVVIYEHLSPFDIETHEHRMAGLLAGFGTAVSKTDELPYTLFTDGNDADDANRLFTGDVLDAYIRDHPKCGIVVSFIGAPVRLFHDSKGAFLENAQNLTRRRLQRDVLFFGIYTDNPYSLGGPIANGEVDSCIVPLREARADQPPSPSLDNNSDEVFAGHYLMLRPDNVFEMWKRNRRMIKITHAPE